ncbi:helix-turn-helix domain-containing protein [Natronogracilivirga saccharolytica]|uniref:Helix-turn-helix transcriptional regulator n=1 Tax=Natronogracilivirga saccharolytica TaxID=2812953 RepID=A0A8J7S8W5_9BACT|nr:AraC family transcriptional regulator [Natronogracilivirga saccharolytica]MBP3192401.1 helix-turn-helix transcriptional regulator [Natronogracilivirga saccharolytica]
MKTGTSVKMDIAYHQMDIAVEIMIRNITEIHNVTDWSQMMGYSRAHFCRRFTEMFGENPKMVLRRARFRQICRVIQSDWSATAYKVARESGIQNEKALHKFLNRNFGIGFLELKDSLKRDAFRSRKLMSKVAEMDYLYIVTGKPGKSDRPAFPEVLLSREVVKNNGQSQHLEPKDSGQIQPPR